jgi:hypothetical protein
MYSVSNNRFPIATSVASLTRPVPIRGDEKPLPFGDMFAAWTQHQQYQVKFNYLVIAKV